MTDNNSFFVQMDFCFYSQNLHNKDIQNKDILKIYTNGNHKETAISCKFGSTKKE